MLLRLVLFLLLGTLAACGTSSENSGGQPGLADSKEQPTTDGEPTPNDDSISPNTPRSDDEDNDDDDNEEDDDDDDDGSGTNPNSPRGLGDSSPVQKVRNAWGKLELGKSSAGKSYGNVSAFLQRAIIKHWKNKGGPLHNKSTDPNKSKVDSNILIKWAEAIESEEANQVDLEKLKAQLNQLVTWTSEKKYVGNKSWGNASKIRPASVEKIKKILEALETAT